MTTADDFVASFATVIGLEAPNAETIEKLLDIAGLAAHSSERWAAPITCYLIGQAGLSPEDALAAVQTTVNGA